MGEAQKKKALGNYPLNMIKQGQGQQIKIDFNNAIQEKCECGSEYFDQVNTIFRISALVSPTGQELIVQQPVLICANCKKRFNLVPSSENN